MKKLNPNDMRKVNGGLYLRCRLCNFSVYAGKGYDLSRIYLAVGMLTAHYLSRHGRSYPIPIPTPRY